jgi:hypothetical protein
MEKKNLKKWLKNQKGVTIADLTISIILISIFTGVIANLMYNNYSMSLDVQRTANADAYATIIMEKVDEKAFDSIDVNFVTTLKDNEEIEVDDDYDIQFVVYDINDNSKMVNGQQIFKYVSVSVTYGDNDRTKKTIMLQKIKVREAGSM